MSLKWSILILFGLSYISLSQRAFATAAGSLTIVGAEQQLPSSGVWDTGTVTVSVNGYPETISYGKYSTATSIASAVAAKFSLDCNAPANARAVGSVVNFQGKGTVASITLQFSTARDGTDFSQDSFAATGLSGSTPSEPMITGITSGTGANAGSITITGIDFGSGGTVTFNGTPVIVSSWSSTTITVTVSGNGATAGAFVVTVDGQSSNYVMYTPPSLIGCPVY
jgi:IPT/TIG domain-containing protein